VYFSLLLSSKYLYKSSLSGDVDGEGRMGRPLEEAETKKKEMGDNFNIISEKIIFPRLTHFHLTAKRKEPQ
jgi:hypothetical protein